MSTPPLLLPCILQLLSFSWQLGNKFLTFYYFLRTAFNVSQFDYRVGLGTYLLILRLLTVTFFNSYCIKYRLICFVVKCFTDSRDALKAITVGIVPEKAIAVKNKSKRDPEGLSNLLHQRRRGRGQRPSQNNQTIQN